MLASEAARAWSGRGGGSRTRAETESHPLRIKLSMSGERPSPFDPAREQKEKRTQHAVHFDGDHFGDEETPIDTDKLVGKLNRWWDAICKGHGQNPREEPWEAIGYHIIELAKNALEHADGGTVTVSEDADAVRVTVSDNGQGFEDPNNDILYGSPGHGLSGVKKWADELVIETNGRKFAKVGNRKKLVRLQDTDVQRGTRITMVKRFEKAG